MKALGVRAPDVLTRVSEFIPEIIEMVTKIIENGFAYESHGSVYFDTVSFARKDSHFYAKLEPWSVGDEKLFQDGEGVLSSKEVEKRSSNDFALWKKSKPGEPVWQSPWGLGRPGWHIECSAMAAKLLGKVLDVHSGGEDLRFPHHDNEIAQSEAYFGSTQWVNYFLHAGHLNIDGLKMSKSLKNFITIREILSKFSAKQIRLLFLLQPWDSVMHYQRVNTMDTVNSKLRAFESFFQKVSTILRESKNEKIVESWNGLDVDLHDFLLSIEESVRQSLLDNFNTPEALRLLGSLVNKAQSYLTTSSSPKGLLLKKIAIFLTKILKTFGLIEETNEFGFSNETTTSVAATEDILKPYLDAITRFRTLVRQAAKEKKDFEEFYTLSDQLRRSMAEQGVKIVDDDPVLSYSFVNKEQLLKEIDEVDKRKAEKFLKQKQSRLVAQKKKLDLVKKKLLTPAQTVRSKFNVEINPDDTVPSQDLNGKELTKGVINKIQKVITDQKRLNEQIQEEFRKEPNFVLDLEREISLLEQEVKLLSK